MKKVLDVQNLTYKPFFDNMNLKLEQENLYILTGKDGCGKTLFAKCLLNLVDYEGNITYENAKIKVEDIGYVGNDYNFIEGTVLDNLLYPLINLEYSETEAKLLVYKLSNKFMLDDILLKNCDEINVENKILVSLLASLVYNPKVLIIDNDLSEMNPILKNKIFKYLSTLGNTLTIFVTKNYEDFLLANKILLISNKKIEVIEKSKLLNSEKLLLENNLNLPFEYNLSKKLELYELIDKEYINMSEMIDDIWE